MTTFDGGATPPIGGRAEAAQGTAHALGSDGWRPTPGEENEIREHVLHDAASVTRSIATAIVLKEGDLFILTEPGGFVPMAGGHGFGLYFHDCRYLDGYELHVAGAQPDVLVSTTVSGFMALSQLVAPDMVLPDGRLLQKESVAIRRERVIDSERLVFSDLITFHNYGMEPIELPVSLSLRAGFDDVFEVRGMPRELRGTLDEPYWRDGTLHFGYSGADGTRRHLAAHFSLQPYATDGTKAQFCVRIAPRASEQLLVSLAVAEATSGEVNVREQLSPTNLSRVEAMLTRSSNAWLAQETEIRSNSLALNAIIDRSLRDLRVLRSSIGGQEFFAAGIPWFAALFGRDSLITALQTLAYDPRIAEQTLRILASYQGTRDDPSRDEEPGKILHELRLGEMAQTGEIPHSPYFGTVDATPLFLILLGRHAAWTGSLALFEELRPNVEAALEWMTRYGDLDGNGYLEYARRSEKGLINQGWKDSGDGIPNADGSLAEPPIALVEVQGYAYMARRSLAEVLRRAGDKAGAEQLDAEAGALQVRFNRDFWLADKGHYALALQRDRQPVAVMSSNPGHVLWTGIADPEKARLTVERLLAPDMFSGWGTRTLSAREVRYNPTGYHLGSIWPHDNSFIAAGFRRYGYGEAAARIFEGIVEAAMNFPDYRLPELFMGFPRETYGVPVAYPVACRPQAWAAGAVPHLLRSLLGLEPEAFEHRLRIVRPVLPPFLQFVEVRRLRVGGARVDLRFERTQSGTVAVDVLKVDGALSVVLELSPTAPSIGVGSSVPGQRR